VSVEVRPKSARIGEPITLTVLVTDERASSVSVEQAFDKSEDSTWTLKQVLPPKDTVTTDGRLAREFGFKLAAFRTGRLDVPPLRMSVEGRETEIPVPPVTIESVLSADETSTEPRDIKPPEALSVPVWISLLGGAVGALLLVALVWALWSLLRRRGASVAVAPATPDAWAMRELDALERDRLIEQKRINEFYTRLSGIVRGYLGDVLSMPVLDMTTPELLGLLADTPLNEEARRLTEEILDESDLVKFAKWIPDGVACMRALERSRRLVEVTRPLLAPPVDPSAGGPQPPAPPAVPRPVAPRSPSRGAELRR